jgi:hypothetical protein
VSQDYALDRVRARRRPPKPPGFPPPWPWWVTALLALVNLAGTVMFLLDDRTGMAVFSGVLFCLNGNFAVRDWQWDRYNRWKGGGS